MVLMVLQVQQEILAVQALLEKLAQQGYKVQPVQVQPALLVLLAYKAPQDPMVLLAYKVLLVKAPQDPMVPLAYKVQPALKAQSVTLVIKDQQEQQDLMVQQVPQDQKEILEILEVLQVLKALLALLEKGLLV
jgi:hypothetical protein